MKVIFYVLFGAFGGLGTWFFLASLFGRYALGDAPPIVAKLALLAGAAAGAGCLYWAYLLGEKQQRWSAGAGAVLLAVFVFQLVQVAASVYASTSRTTDPSTSVSRN